MYMHWRGDRANRDHAGGPAGTGIRLAPFTCGVGRFTMMSSGRKETSYGYAEHGCRRTGQVWLQAGAGPVSRAVLLVCRGVQLHLDHDRRVRAVLLRLPLGWPGDDLDL